MSENTASASTNDLKNLSSTPPLTHPDMSFIQLLENRSVFGRHLMATNVHCSSADPYDFATSAMQKRYIIDRLGIEHRLDKHGGCVNVAKWNLEGNKLITGSDDCFLNIWSYPSGKLLHNVTTGHTRNIFAAHFLPRDENITLSGGMDCQIRECNIERQTNHKIVESDSLVSKINFIPWTDSVFISCHYDGRLRITDMRLPREARTRVLIRMPTEEFMSDYSASAIAFDPINGRQFALCGGDADIRVFDLRSVHDSIKCSMVRRFRAYDNPNESLSASGIDWSPYGFIAVTWQGRPMTLFDIRDASKRPDCVEFQTNQSNSNDQNSSQDASQPIKKRRIPSKLNSRKKIDLSSSDDEDNNDNNNNNNNNLNPNDFDVHLPPINQEILDELLDIGFSEGRAKKALLLNRNATLEEAIEWIGEHQDDDDIDAPLSMQQLQSIGALRPKRRLHVPAPIRTALSHNLCTFTVTGNTFSPQAWYRCHTCRLIEAEGCCESCAKVCHFGHELSVARDSEKFYCDCGAGRASCLAMGTFAPVEF